MAAALPINRFEINGLVTPQTAEATVLELGLFDQENTLPEELTQLRMGKIVRERYPELSAIDQEAIRQHAIAAMNVTQQAKLALAQADAEGGGAAQGNTALLDGVRKFVNVRDLDIDLIDRINPFEAAYAVLATLALLQPGTGAATATSAEQQQRARRCAPDRRR